MTYNCAINILGVQIDSRLTFTNHVREIAKKAARKLACIHCIAPLLDGNGCYTLYNSRVRSLMEYCPLVWSGCPHHTWDYSTGSKTELSDWWCH